MLTQPKLAKKTAQFIKLLRLIDQFKFVTLDKQSIWFWQQTPLPR